MKNTYLFSTLVVLSALSLNASADAAAAPAPSSAAPAASAQAAAAVPATPQDPTLDFFTALSNCTPGNYTETNVISSEVGQPTLSQQIIGPSQDNLSCNATLTTPDGRSMTCMFPMEQLPQLNDQHFMQGMLQDTTDSPSQDSINADMIWSQMKMDNCSLN